MKALRWCPLLFVCACVLRRVCALVQEGLGGALQEAGHEDGHCTELIVTALLLVVCVCVQARVFASMRRAGFMAVRW